MRKQIVIKEDSVHITQDQIRHVVHLMDLEEVAGIGNGLGHMELDLVNLSFIQKIRLFKNKDGLVSVLDPYITNRKIFSF